jgi:hypothetical protein
MSRPLMQRPMHFIFFFPSFAPFNGAKTLLHAAFRLKNRSRNKAELARPLLT